jgi:hypothetical protein
MSTTIFSLHAIIGIIGILASTMLFTEAFEARRISRARQWRAGLAVALFTGLVFGRLIWCGAIQP